MVVLSKFLAFVLVRFYKPSDQKINFTKLENFLYALVVKFRLNFYFYRGYAVGRLLYSKLLDQTLVYNSVAEELIVAFKLKDSELDTRQRLNSIVLGVGGLDFNWYLRFFNGFLYFCSQACKLNYVCNLEGNVLNQIYLQGGQPALNLEYKSVLEKFGANIGVLISVYNFDDNNKILGHNELMLLGSVENSFELEHSYRIGEKGIQNMSKIFENYRNLFDNDIEQFMEALKIYSQVTKTNEQLRIGLRNNCTYICLCAILQSGEFMVIPVYV